MNSPKHTMQGACALVGMTLMIFTPLSSQVDIKVGGGLGIISPMADLGGSTIEYYGGSGYGLSTGYGAHGKGKFGFSGVNLVGEIDYSTLNSTGNSEPGQGKVEVAQTILSFKVGPEFHISVPALPLTPYLGAHLAWNAFSGETSFQGVANVPSATYSVQAATRLGAGVTVGAEIGIGPLLALDVSIAYSLMNIAGKAWNDINPGTDQRIDSYLSLNDERDPQYAEGEVRHFIANARSMQSILFTVSILFGL